MASIRIVLRPARRRQGAYLPGIWRDEGPCSLDGASLIGKSTAGFSRHCWATSPYDARMALPAGAGASRLFRRDLKIS